MPAVAPSARELIIDRPAALHRGQALAELSEQRMREVLISLELWGAPLPVNAEDDNEVSALFRIAVRRAVISWIEQNSDEEARFPAAYEVNAESTVRDP